MPVSQQSELESAVVPAAVATCTPFAGAGPSRESSPESESESESSSEPEPASSSGSSRPVLAVENLRVTVGHGRTEAVRGVSFEIGRGEIVGLVGASGSGKTLTCRAILGLNSAGVARSGGRILLGDTDLAALDRRGWDAVRGNRIGTVFQDPASYLNPSVTVGRQLAEALRIKLGLDRRAAREEALALFASVGLRDPETVYHQYPHELSGGMAQRVLIAIAVSGEPELLVADEATSSLDVLVQAGVLRLLRRLAAERGLALLLVTHDLAVVAEVCDRVLVCSDGELVEQGSAAAVIAAPEHAATRALVEAAAVWHPVEETRTVGELALRGSSR